MSIPGVHRQFALARRYHNPLACVMVDVDLFRDFNARYGDSTGDWMLQGVASVMKQNVREVDLIARYGGEEFIILLPMTDLVGASSLAERLRAPIDQHLWESPSSGNLRITVSLGVAAIPAQDIETAEHLVACADKALHRAKAKGRNRVETYEAWLEGPSPSRAS